MIYRRLVQPIDLAKEFRTYYVHAEGEIYGTRIMVFTPAEPSLRFTTYDIHTNYHVPPLYDYDEISEAEYLELIKPLLLTLNPAADAAIL